MTLYIGIDPGKTGGIAAVSDDGTVWAQKMENLTERDIFDALHEHDLSSVFVTLEQVHAMPGGGKRKMGAASAFSFGRNYGFLRGVLIASKIPFDECPPQRWQKAMNCRTGGDKNVSKAKAQQLFPAHTWTHATADAVLIAEYNRRVRTGQLAAK